ncbi:MAG: class I SAM-dependent methyltransferase [Vicinamibacterales bacterium]
MLTRLRHSRPVGLLRYHLYRDVLLTRPRRHACNICGWRGRRFLTYVHKFVLCPKCGSQVRHRLIASALAELPIGRRAPVDGARVLHMSVEYCLGLLLATRARRYVRSELIPIACDARADATCMPFLAGTFDLVVCCDVLEHIPDDRAAIGEIHRLLRPGGTAIVTVPQSDAGIETYEDPQIASAEYRAREYGQPDHVRNYGADFANRLAAPGFVVAPVSAASFGADYVAHHVLRPPVPLAASWGWNDRRVYFAEKRP